MTTTQAMTTDLDRLKAHVEEARLHAIQARDAHLEAAAQFNTLLKRLPTWDDGDTASPAQVGDLLESLAWDLTQASKVGLARIDHAQLAEDRVVIGANLAVAVTLRDRIAAESK